MTKRYKLDRVDTVDNRPPPDKNFSPKQVWQTKGYIIVFSLGNIRSVNRCY